MAEIPSAAVVIPDAHLLFSGDFVRSGVDLILSDQLHRVVVPNYFRDHARPLLVSPEGAHLDPGVIDALTGHTQYAQAGAPAASGKVVGHVVKMTGSASIVRNGVTIVANVGDAIYQNDVVQTGSDSTLGLVLDDGTTFNLSASARFMLNELTYDASSTSNSSLMTLVQGAASFVAGQVAKTGDMRVATPSATIGIRGTAVILDVSATDGKVSVSVIDQRDGLVHAVQVFNTAGVLIGTVTSNGSTLTLTPTATFDVIAQQSNKTTDQVAQEFGAFQQVLSTYDSGKQLFPNLPQHTENRDNNNNNPNPNSTTKFAGSPPLQPPGTEYHPPLGTSATPPSSATPPTVVVTVNPASDSGTSPPPSNIVVGEAIIVPVKLSAVPFVVTPPNVAAITSGPGDHIGPVMSANGDVVYDPDGAIYFFNHETGATTTIASPANGWSYGSPTISFDGRYIVYQGSDGGGSFVFVYGTDPSDPAHYHVQTELAPGSAPAVSGDGGTIVVQQDGGNVSIYGLDGTLKGTVTPGAVGSSGALWKPAISADGHLIAFWNSDVAAPGGGGRLLAFDLSTGELAVIAGTSAGAGTVAPTISADGRMIAYQETDGAGHSEIYLYDLNAGAVVFHTSNASGSSYSPVLSPDGHFIVFTSEARLTSADQNGFADIYIVDVTNPAAPAYRLVSDGVDTASNGGAAISAGGQYVAFGNSSNIFFADPTSGLSAIILETAKSSDVLAAKGSIAVTGDYTGVTVSVTDQFGDATPYFSASFDANGHINWSFAEPKSDFAGLSFGETATQEFIIRLSADNGSITVPVFVTVHDGVQPAIQTADAAPVAAPVTLAQGLQDSPYVIAPTVLLKGVADIDGPSLSITSLTIQSGGGGLIQNSDQTWTYTPDPGFSGRVVFGYTVSDSIKSAASTASLNITLPLAITAISPDSGASGDFITNSTQLSVSGSNGALSPGEKIQVSSDNGLTWSDVVQATGTTWSLIDPGVHNASFSYQVRVVDSVGNTIGSAAQAVTIDTASPVVTIDNSDALTNQATQRIAGTVGLADAGTTVIVFDNAQAVAGAVVQADGSWSVIVQLSEGGNSFVAQDTDVAGNLGSSNTVVLTLDSTPPAPVASVGTLSADSGSSPTDFNTNVASQTVSGTYTGALGPGETIQVSANNGATWVTASASGGNWSASSVSLSSGTNLLSVRTIDLAGNITAGTGHSYTLDTLAPTAVATVTLLSSDTGSSSTDFVTNIPSQTVSGTYTGVLAFGETIQVSADGGVSWVTATANAANGTWLASGLTLSAAGNTLSVRTIDLAGNVAAGTGHSYTFDTVAPSAIATVTALGSDSGSSASDFISNVALQTVSGTYSGALGAGESIQVSADGGTTWVTAVANASNGTWAASGVTLSAAGSTLSVRTIDLAGNSVAGTGHAYTLDTSAPSAVATVIALGSDSGSSSSDFVTNVASQTVTGTYTGALSPGESIQLSVDGANWVTANAAGGAWSASGVLLSGAGSLLSVRTIDLAGNIAAGTGHSYTLDQTVPSGGTPDLIASSDSGSSSSDNNTNVLAPTLTVALGAGVAVGDTVQLLLNGSSFSHPLVRTVTSGDIAAQNVSFAVSPGDLGPDGTKPISARFTDLAGNSSTTSALTITLDTSAAVLAITNPGGNTNQSVQTITGTADPADAGAIVTVLDDGTPVGVATIQANGTWSTDVTLHSDANSLTAQATDAAGNQGVSNTVVFTLNTNAPSGGTPDLATASDSGSSSSDNTTNVTAPTFTVALGANVAAGDTIQLLLNGSPFAHPVTHTISAADISAQSVSLTVTDGDLGPDGAKSISARLSDSFGNTSTTAALIITLDTAAPTVSSEAITSATGAQNNTLNAGDVVSVTVTFSESVTVTGTPQLALNIGGTPVQASYASGSGSTQLVFTYTIQAGQNDANGISIDTNALSLNGGTITDAAGNVAVLTAAAVTDNASYKVDTAGPTVSSEAITSATGVQNGTLNAGDVVSVTVTFSESVTVTGTPQLALNIGGTPVQASYASGSGSSQLVFTYTIQAGQNDANGISINANALSLNGGTITDVAGNAAVLTAAAVADNVSYKVDTAAPTVSSEAITSATGAQNSTLNAGDVVSVTVSFSESVTVTGTPQLALNIGGTPVQASYASGSGGTQLVFTYTIQAGQNDANGISLGANALSLNGGTIADAAGNAAVLTAAAVADNASYKVDTAAPTVSGEAITSATGAQNGTLNAGDVVSVTVSFSESVTVTGTPQLALNIGGTPVQASYASGSGSTQLVFTYTIQAGQNDANGISIDTNALSLNGGTITDAAGNVAVLTAAAVTDNASYKVDTAGPTVSSEAITSATGVQNGTLNAGDVVSVTVTFSESVTVTGTPQLALNIGGTPVQASYASGSGSSQLVFTYTIQAGQNDANGISIDVNALSLNGGTITDAAGNAAVLTAAAVADNASYKVDTAAPTVSSEAITSATGAQNNTLNAGDVVSVTVTFSESVTVTGAPQLALNIGGTPVQASYASGSGSTQLVFTYTIQAGQNDANGISINANALSLNGGTMTDAAGNAAVLTAAAVADNASYKVDTAAPTVSSEAITSATGAQNGTLNAGDVVSVTVTFSESVTVTGAPQLALNIGGTPVQASYASGSGSTQLVFTYTIQAGQNDANGISINANALGLNGGTIADAAGNAAVLTAAAVADNASYKVDTAAPTVSGEAITSATGAQNSTLNAGDVVSVTVTFSESVTVTGTPQLALNIGGTPVQASYASGSGSTQLVFTYTIQAGQNDANGISLGANALGLNGGTITDAAGNVAVLTAAAVADNASYVVDTGSPTESVAISSVAGSSSSTSTSIIVTGTNGTLAFGDKVQISTDNATWTDVVRNGLSRWTFTDSTVRSANFTYFTRVVDSAGNVGATASLPILVASGGASVAMSPAGGVVEFTGSGGTLQIGAAVTATINAISIASGPVAIGGSANITTSAGDAIDLYATGASAGNPANLTVNPTGQITGAGSAISVIQNAAGSITVTTSGTVTGLAGRGILAQQNATGTGSILINGSGSVTGTGAAFSGIVAVNLNSANNGDITVSQSGNIAGGHDGIRVQTNGNGNIGVTTAPNPLEATAQIIGSTLYGIEAQSKGTGNIQVNAGAGTVITSGGVGINAYNEAVSLPKVGGVIASSISINASGAINSGTALTGQGGRPAGILAGYKGGATNTVNSSVFGNVVISNSATINAAGGDGIRGYNFGPGNVFISNSGTIVASDVYGIAGSSSSTGNVSVTTTASSSITSGSHGILAINQGTSILQSLGSTVTVTAAGTINSGVHLSAGGAQPAGISAGYYGSNGTSNPNINGSVLVDNAANISARAGYGIIGFNVGYGNITIINRADKSVSGAQFGIFAGSSVNGTASPSNVSISVEANSTPTAAAVTASSLMGLAAINANNTSGGNITITTGANDQFMSGGYGINANSAATSVASGNQISVTTSTGAINSGFNFLSGGGTPAGISAGYSVVSPANIHGNVVVDNAATVTAASGPGINLYNNGNGTISATLRPTSSVVAAQGSGVNAFSAAGGSITINNQGVISAAGIGISVGNGSSASVNGLISISNSGTINAPGVPFMPVVAIGNGNSTQTATISNAAGKFIASSLFARTTNNFAISVFAGNGSVTNNGSITGNISFSGTGSGSVNNTLGATWNINGSNFFGSGANAISNAGIINMLGLAALSGAGAIALSNTGNISVLPNSSAQIFANVTGAGSILLGDHSALELGLSVAATQTINFGGRGLLTFDNPASVGANLPLNFSASGSGNVGSIITLGSGGITAANISGSTLTVSGVQNYAFQVSGTGLSGNMFDVLSSNRIVLVPTSATIISGVTTSQSPLTPVGFYILDNDHINSSTGPGFNLSTTDGVAANTYTVVANASSDIVINGAFPGLRVATQGASGAIINAANISGPTASTGPNTGLVVDATQGGNSGSGSADIVNFANVSGVANAISATTVNGNINIVSVGAALTGTNSYGILGVSNGTGGVTITTSGGTINAGFNGIRAAALQETTPGPGGNIIIYNSSTITSGTNTANIAGSGAAGLRARILNNNTTVPNAVITGDVTIENRASITAQAGAGIFADNYGSGNTSVTFAPGQYAITAVNGGATGIGSGLTQYGIFAFTYGTGSSLVNAGWGTTITSGSTGINAGNQATAIASGSASTVSVYSQGFISSGTNVNNGGSAQSAIQAGYNPGGNGAFSSAVYGDVIVNVASDGNPFGNSNPTLLAAAGPGVLAYDYGVGNIAVSVGLGVSIQALTAATSSAGGNAPYGIGATNRGSGNIVVVVSSSSISPSSINSGSSGINAVNDANPTASTPDLINLFAANVAAGKPAVVAVTAAGTITSGSLPTNSGGTPSGIAAGFFGGGGHANQYVSGNVFINNAADVSAAGFGLQGYNYGYGNITINDASGADITAGSNGIYAHADGGFTDPVTSSALSRDIAVTVYANTTITAGSATFNKAYGILALSTNAGSISVVTSTGDTIDSHQGGAGINAVNEATSIAPSFNSSVIVTNAAFIHSGIGTTGFNSQPAGILAGYIGQATDPSLNNPPNPANYNVYGEVVVNNFGDITADAGDGIRAYSYGVGDVDVSNFGGTIIALGGASPPNGTGVGILAQNFGPGSIHVTTSATTSITSGSSGIAAVNKATKADPLNPSVVVPATSEVFVNASGTIHSGTTPTGTVAADPAAGILAGYNPNNQNTANDAVHGNVVVHDHATIVAPTGTDGIRAVNYGVGDIAVTVESDSRVFAGRYGVAAFGFDGGDVSVTIDGSVIGGTAGLDVTTTGTGLVTIDNAGVVEGIVLGYNATFTNEAGADWQFSGASAFTGTSTLSNAGTIESTGTSSILGLAGFTNTGTIAVESGSLAIGTAVTGGGAAVIYSASLVFSAAADANVTFDTGKSTPGTLVLADAAHFTGTVTGFAFGDAIDLVGIAPTNVSVSSSGGLHVDFGVGSFALAGSYDPTGFLIASDGQGGAKISWNHQGPVIDTSQLTVNFNSGTYTVSGIQVTDSDPSVPTAPVVTYTPGGTPPAYEKVALTLSDIAGATQVVNFIFQNGTGTTVQGTSGNDVIFAASGQDVLTGGGGRDQFVFAAPPASTPVQHTITDFTTGIDKLDVRQFTNVSWASAADSPNDTVVTLDANDSILLKNIVASNLKAGDFIFHV
ncbi:Ig-like domain-containing protein [Bradyrhizobium huanghuaihaiense]|uniref:Ig-like domain-containing protein n=1 Tax=Bradyrhizobium huanghuaihaiense TaxID=990078 RepID=UPI0021AAD0EF|nr:Ig-like domain-containing protein [Bradyrhizobium sp. CB3035]UWU74072.1 Ig-like domain-containing protein [Bradyrhizobium sp. CB3035]